MFDFTSGNMKFPPRNRCRHRRIYLANHWASITLFDQTDNIVLMGFKGQIVNSPRNRKVTQIAIERCFRNKNLYEGI